MHRGRVSEYAGHTTHTLHTQPDTLHTCSYMQRRPHQHSRKLAHKSIVAAISAHHSPPTRVTRARVRDAGGTRRALRPCFVCFVFTPVSDAGGTRRAPALARVSGCGRRVRWLGGCTSPARPRSEDARPRCHAATFDSNQPCDCAGSEDARPRRAGCGVTVVACAGWEGT